MSAPTERTGDEPTPGAREVVVEAVRALWTRHRDTILARVEAVEEAARALELDALTEPLRERARLEAHRLVGTLGVFGLEDGSEVAQRLEEALRADAVLDAEAGRRMREDADWLRRVLESRA